MSGVSGQEEEYLFSWVYKSVSMPVTFEVFDFGYHPMARRPGTPASVSVSRAFHGGSQISHVEWDKTAEHHSEYRPLAPAQSKHSWLTCQRRPTNSNLDTLRLVNPSDRQSWSGH